MFTGLIQSLGRLSHRGNGELHIRYPASVHPLLADLDRGDSIAVNGICLTVEAVTPQGFRADVSPETLARTTLGELPEGSWVNLESSLRAGGKIGGHFVTGHIDGCGVLEAAQPTANAWVLSFRVSDRRVARYLVPKGSIAVNGISLTIADCSPRGDWFSVAVIPVTYGETTLQYLQPGQPVNLEADLLGKYVEKFLQGHRGDSALPSLGNSLSLEFLTEHGYSL